jgi:hypothetical protein
LTEQSSLAVKAKQSSCEKSTDVTVFECPCAPNHTGVVTSLRRGEERQCGREPEGVRQKGPRQEEEGARTRDLKDVEERHLAARVP